MSVILSQTKRNAKIYFKDKGLFFMSLITPIILLVLFITFLADVYKDSFRACLPEGLEISDKVINAIAGGQVVSSLLAVSCVTVAFCSNLIMVADKVSGARRDILMSPIKKSSLAISYYLASAAATLIITLTATSLCFIYLAFVGWYLSACEAFLIIFDVILLTLFGVSLSSVVIVFLSTNGQASAVGSIVSSIYGFVCGAYMPMSSFPEWLQKVVMFLPGTYGTSLFRNHCLAGIYRELDSCGVGVEYVEALKDSVDCNIYFFGTKVEVWVMYLVLALFIAVCVGAYVLINILKKEK